MQHPEGFHPWQQREALAPFYVRRALDAFPERTPVGELLTGLDNLARTLPIGSAVLLVCLQRLSDRAVALLRDSGKDVGASLELVRLLAYLVLVLDIQARQFLLTLGFGARLILSVCTSP